MKIARISLCFILYIIIGAALAQARTYSVDQIPNVQLTDYTKHLSNPDGIISPVAQARIDSMLLDIRRKSSAEVVAVVVDSINTDDIDRFATQLLRTWGVGKSDKNNGVVILVAKDNHQAVIRTGTGADGILPDILAGRILHDTMFPKFRQEDYEGGVLAGVQEVHRLITDPEAAEEVRSAQADNYRVRGDNDNFFTFYLWMGIVAAIVLLAWLAFIIAGGRGKSDYEKYTLAHGKLTSFTIVTVLFIGIPVIATLILWALCKHWRNHARRCPRCNAQMCKLDEDTDNQYLTMAQDLEEQLQSVDYDVWLCPQCGETDIYSFVNKQSIYSECPKCHAHTLKLAGTRVLQHPTVNRTGVGERIYTCVNPRCGHQHGEDYEIPKKTPPPPPVIPLGGGGRGFGGGFGGGGFGGGFGGGGTLGGGASGRW